jgi:hypothetical protein
MTVYTAQCYTDRRDTVTATVDSNAVWLEPSGVAVGMQPDDARTFARGILALADEVDEGEKAAESTPAEEPTVRGIKVGDKARVLVDGAEGAEVLRGDVFVVSRLSGSTIIVDFEEGDRTYKWYFREAESLEKVTDEPVIDASKIVVLDDSAPARAALLSQARDLMSGEDYTAHDLIALADYLAGEK